MAQVQKKTSTMSLTISSCSQDRSSSCSSSSSSSTLQQRHSSTVQPLCISPRVVRTNEVLSPTQCSGNAGVSPTFVKCLQDVSTVNGQLVVLECRIRGTPPLEVSWYREHEQIIDSADFRILRKKASSASVPEELCTLVITEAYPEDSGIFKCMASNNFGTVSCSAMLEVYTDLEEVLGDEDEPSSISSAGLAQDDLPLILQDTLIPPPEWPDISEEETTAPLAGLPKPILKKTVSRPASRSTDEEIQGSKDALIQDLEKKLRNKAPPQSHSQQKMSYEERMARRLLGSDNAASVFDLENSFSVLPAQPGSPDAHHRGGIWSRKNHSGVDGTEASTIQEKFFAPRFVQVPQDLTVEEGRFCRIDFKVVGLPTPDISWYLDGKPIQPDDYHKMMVCEKSVHSFIIEIVTIHHAGVYECVAKNRAGQSHFSLCLDVIAQEQLCPPSFMVKMRNCRVLEGDTVRLESKVSASPAPQIYWKKDKEMLRIDPMRMSLSQDSSGKQCLVIDSVMKSDAGWYTVSAINEVGMSNCNARLDVGTRLNKTASPAKPLKMLPMVNQFSTLRTGPPSRHSAPLYESEEL
ncbi:palladin-like isoform X3 [Xyrauchen texanus]|uniref:palladin-like isoform X3 n=1 Tax=Xyrauchen texanus TaxID=154827 RepID=UPI002241E8F3|nr:palladin-like isoform X3 [Xyrauchen texanus]